MLKVPPIAKACNCLYPVAPPCILLYVNASCEFARSATNRTCKKKTALLRRFFFAWTILNPAPVRVRLRQNGSRKPSPGPKLAESWPFGLRSSRLRPSRAARSACTRSTALARFLSYDTGKTPVARASPGDATARVLDQRTTQEITLQLPTARARSLPARG